MSEFGYGLAISYGDNADPVVYTEFGEVVSIPFPEIESGEVEATHLQSPDRYRQFIKGWKDAGEIELTLRFSEAQYKTILDLDDENRDFKIEFPSGATLEFEGFIKKLGAVKELDDIMQMTVGIRVSGKPTFTLAS